MLKKHCGRILSILGRGASDSLAQDCRHAVAHIGLSREVSVENLEIADPISRRPEMMGGQRIPVPGWRGHREIDKCSDC